MGFNCKKWLNIQASDVWPLLVAACSLVDIDPESGDISNELIDVLRVIIKDTEDGSIKHYMKDNVPLYLRRDFIAWAVSKGFAVRDEMLDFVKYQDELRNKIKNP